MKKSVLFGAGLLAALVASGAARAEGELVLGYMMAKSGPYVSLANTNEVAVDMAVEEINAKGGINGKKIKVVKFDTAGDPKQATTALRSFAQDAGALAVIGPFSSSEVRTTFPVGEREGLAQMSMASSAPGLTKGFTYGFRNTTDEGKVIDQVLAAIKDKKLPMASGAAAYATDDVVSKSIGTVVVPKMFEKYAIPSKGSVDFQLAAFDLSPQVAQLKQMAPDIVGLGSPPEGAVNLAKELKRQGVSTRIIGGTTIADPELPKRMDGAGDNLTIGTTFFPEVNDKTKAFTAEFGKRTKAAGLNRTDPNQMDASVYDIVYLYSEAMKRANVTGDKAKLAEERAAIRDQLAKLKDYQALEGAISFTDGDAVKPVYILEVKGGKWTLLDTRTPN
ncbi:MULTISPECIES: ABC transporter substrate-binding protein [Xanthobacter]|uniref:ABC transporter substrate-binding protein n=1 Tax=Xanthobacter TaxID=279 RepID=UPI00145DAD8B|nr:MULTISPECIES: ABC transporter substrate-binding protein [Xanthobacter]MBN8916923.1 ABC transporter substrate-binding protein [Hyphomicrobiales bacterium]NMN60603.1 branched-chain amino acid transport system substrate-binding protein [Xanthobacter sp. SG618]UDQ89486.1 ABC transporter substrate-binding protein [Xanthobacter autotrophicus]UJX43710.1 ABC transporter substrate-binding protein [Xanthobacter sp. YC-JY1]